VASPENSPGKMSPAAVRLELSVLLSMADSTSLLEKAQDVRRVLVLVDEMIRDQFDGDTLILALARSVNYEILSRSLSTFQARVLSDFRRSIALRRKALGQAVSIDTIGKSIPPSPSAKQKCPHCSVKSCRARSMGGCRNYCHGHAQCSLKCQAAYAARRPRVPQVPQ
jgi:hypothetical protein